MLGQQFYHETMRNVIVAFGTLFNNIHLVRKIIVEILFKLWKYHLRMGQGKNG